ncbi:MAG: endolytic transglycosylase MltG [Desulfuromonas sp.]|nr:MAG: endolytic transglycosylase MltG [Desulfuromonas sp.]
MRLRRVILFFLILTLLIGATTSLWLVQSLRPPEGEGVTVEVIIPKGASLSSVAKTLVGAGVIRNATTFGLYARWQKAGPRIKAGEYLFALPVSASQVLQQLLAGEVRRYRLTIPEGLTLVEIATRLDEAQLADGNSFLRLARSPDSVTRLALEGPTLEGFLFPETYLLEKKQGEEAILKTMVDEFKRRCTPELLQEAAGFGLDRLQLVTLASIVQKEAGNREEMPQIAAVFHNRLRRGMPLQADPTVIYGIENFNGNLTRRDLETWTPYNTYRIPGLPPGPIANPGDEALWAVAKPARSDALYFVARGDGTHAFSRTLKEHNAAVRRYQLKR